jgi:apolipoprotein N-acyltransferase
LPVVWILFEYLRGQWVFNGFPWFQIAYSQLDTPLAGYIPILGVYGVGWLLAITASIITLSILYKNKLSIVSLLFVCCFWVMGWLLKDLSWTYSIGSPIKVTMIQGNIAQDEKWNPEYRNKIMQIYKEKTNQHWDSQIIIWPESSVPAFLDQVNESFIIPLDQEAKSNATDLIISLPIKTEQFIKYNAVITRGNNNAEYHKIHLLPFGEYLPLQPFSSYILSSLKTLPVGSFTAGSIDQPLLEAGGYAFITSICYEDAFGEEAIRNLSKAAFLVNVTNDGWFGDSLEPYQHMQIARMRALEAGRYLLRATNNGVTAFVSPKGKVIKQAPLFMETTITDEILPMAGLTPYSKYGDKPVIYVLCFIFIFTIIVNRCFYKRYLPRIFSAKDSSQ